MAANYIAVQALLPFIAMYLNVHWLVRSAAVRADAGKMQLKLEHLRHFITTHAHLYSHFQTYLPWKFCGDMSKTIH